MHLLYLRALVAELLPAPLLAVNDRMESWGLVSFEVMPNAQRVRSPLVDFPMQVCLSHLPRQGLLVLFWHLWFNLVWLLSASC